MFENVVLISPQGGAILLLTGPSGSGKTATVRVLARDLGFQIQEWSNPSTTSQYTTDDLFTQSFDPGEEIHDSTNSLNKLLVYVITQCSIIL